MAGLGRIAIAALGILAYKNRDKLKDWVSGVGATNGPDGKPRDGNILDQLAGSSGGLRDLLDRFRNAGKGQAVDSWVSKGPNEPLNPASVEAAIDEETLQSLSTQTGFTREELLSRLARDLPDVVNEMTPDGRLPEKALDQEEPTLLDPAPSRGGA
jgi:uncharacterized protein YidB (DUF937 family)